MLGKLSVKSPDSRALRCQQREEVYRGLVFPWGTAHGHNLQRAWSQWYSPLGPVAHPENETSNEGTNVAVLYFSQRYNATSVRTCLGDGIQDTNSGNVEGTAFEGACQDDLGSVR
jgi:hypothetical protein